MEIKPVLDLTPYQAPLFDLLAATVEDGASIGFLHPVYKDIGNAYWRSVQKDVLAGTRILLLALSEDALVGSVQLALAGKENARHRVEVEKLMVHPDARGSGTGRKLMQALEATTRAAGRSLIMLDTRTDDIAEGLYHRLGYQLVGKVPGFTLEADGRQDGTSIFYKHLSP
jgi:acetyltransferase